MVQAVFDPTKIPQVTLSPAELEEIANQIEAGNLPRDYLIRYFDGQNANVFGSDAPKDRHGNRKEQGLGSQFNQTQQSIDAYIRWCGPNKDRPNGEPDFEENLKRMQGELAKSRERAVKESPISKHLKRGAAR